MLTQLCLRWTERRGRYRPADERIATHEYDVAPIAGDAVAKQFVLDHHYSGTYPAARFRFGLYRHGALVGVAIYSHPASERVLAVFPCERLQAVELGRFVLRDEVPGNGETWFLARTFEQLRGAGIAGVVSFSDPVARQDDAGRTVFGGHVGTIYQAHNALYLGRATPRTLRLLRDGRALSARALQKLRARERGWRYVVAQLEEAGAAPLRGDAGEWLREQLPRVSRAVRHHGNHKYVWGLDRAMRRALAALPAQAYPKLVV